MYSSHPSLDNIPISNRREPAFYHSMSDYQRLESLPYPVYFVRNDPELCESLAAVTQMPPFEQFYRPELGGTSSWIVQTYLQLKCRGLDVHLVPHYVPGAICVVSREELMKSTLLKTLPFRSYVVVCQQDRPRPAICEQRIVQNRLNIHTKLDHYLPHWVQPELKPRNLDRQTKIQTLVFKGRWYYMPADYKTPGFIKALENLGVSYTVTPDYAVNLNDWSDYSEADLLLAVRHRSNLYLESKPPTKLINAWLAGCPALLGPEPAYQNLRQSELDYIEINSPDDVLAALHQLQADPDLYWAMIENGWERSQAFLPSRTATLWRDLLAGPIATGYEHWRHQPWLWQTLGRPAHFALRLIKQELERRHFNKLTGRKR